VNTLLDASQNVPGNAKDMIMADNNVRVRKGFMRQVSQADDRPDCFSGAARMGETNVPILHFL